MRPLALAVALVVALLNFAICSRPLIAETSVCRKNIVIYFDTSKSMENPAAGTNLKIRELMLEFLRQALDSPQLVSENDSLKIKLFVEDPRLAWSSNDRPLTQQLKSEAYNTVEPTIKKGELGDNDFTKLENDFKSELEGLKPEPNTTTYILVFSDFFYNPSAYTLKGRNRQIVWKQQRDQFKQRLADLSPLFDRKRAKLVYWYQQNNGTDGTNLGDLLTSQDYLHRIENTASIPGLVESISKEFRASLRPSGPKFLYTREGLKLNMVLNNTNCFPVRIKKLSVGQIGNREIGSPLAEVSSVDSSEIVNPGSQRTISIALRGSPDLHALRTKYINHTYDVRVTMASDAGSSDITLRLELTEDAFWETVGIRRTEAVLVKHILYRSERIFLQIVLDGNILEEKTVKVIAHIIPETGLTADGPEQGNYVITPNDMTLPRVLIFSFPDIDQELKWESTDPKVFSLSIDAGGKSLNPLNIEISKTKDYRLIEWALLILMLIAGVSIRVHYARQTRQR